MPFGHTPRPRSSGFFLALEAFLDGLRRTSITAHPKFYSLVIYLLFFNKLFLFLFPFPPPGPSSSSPIFQMVRTAVGRNSAISSAASLWKAPPLFFPRLPFAAFLIIAAVSLTKIRCPANARVRIFCSAFCILLLDNAVRLVGPRVAPPNAVLFVPFFRSSCPFLSLGK